MNRGFLYVEDFRLNPIKMIPSPVNLRRTTDKALKKLAESVHCRAFAKEGTLAL